MPKIVVYVDQGVSGESVKQTVQSMQQEIDHSVHTVQRLDAAAIRHGGWKNETALFIMPGGKDVYYQSELGDKGVGHIRDFVAQGGKYLGICAGAYFAADEIEFEKGGTLEVCGARQLKFFPGIAKGSAYGPNKYAYDSHRGTQAACISWNTGPCYTYFNGGCFFADPEKYPSVRVLSTYEDLEGAPAAIVSCVVGLGKAVLSGVHIEYSAQLFSPDNPYLKQIHPLLEKAENQRRVLFREVLHSLDIHLRPT